MRARRERGVRRRPLLWILGAFVLLIGALVVTAWALMIRVKPSVERPVLDVQQQREIEALRASLRGHVEMLAVEIGERHLAKPQNLERAATYIETRFSRAGDPHREPFDVEGRSCANVVLELPGTSDRLVIVGAHYDTAFGTPGADDNATGVAALLEIAAALRGTISKRTIRFVAFVNEEPPHFRTPHMGSAVHALGCKAAGDTIDAMLALEMLGSFSTEAGSQRYPSPFSWFYPSTGDFIAVVGNLDSRSLVRDCLEHFQRASDFPVEGVATFASLPGIDWSDHRSFWAQGYPAVMWTDTALFRNRNYHEASDTLATIDFESFARVVHGLISVVRDLANSDED
ncbi:MAG: M20/M25/M40 family metallo-hydrolase [Planctomycetes bacterium]|nr:M20/M25/M40 family metallo-hydrolase [Planctomycetota bacterium]